MKQIYRFDAAAPPPVNERSLRAELERRKLKRQTALFALAGMLIDWCLIAAAIALYPVNPTVSIACFAYAGFALCGGGAVAIVFTRKRRVLL